MSKSNFDPDNKMHTACGRHLGGLLLAHDACLNSYWIRGEENPVADSLSRDSYLSNTQLAYLFSSFYPNQMPYCFRFLTLTLAMICFMTSLVQDSMVQTEFKKQPKKISLSIGQIGQNILQAYGGEEHLTSMVSASTINAASLPPFSSRCATADFRPEIVSELGQSPTPLLQYWRPLWKATAPTPFATSPATSPATSRCISPDR